MKTEKAVDCLDCGYKGTESEFEIYWPPEDNNWSGYYEYCCPECDSENIKYYEFEREFKEPQ